ncbi:MAG: Bug family tripartite tricarboxylate transporter substrate binding protein [Burkholderiales bacterium]
MRLRAQGLDRDAMRAFFTLAGGAVLCAGLESAARAAEVPRTDDFPARPLRFIVPIAPGGGVDTTARSLGQNLTGRIGQPVVIENRPGGGGSIGAEITANAAPDGHTAMVTSSSFVIHSLLYTTRYDPVRDFAPVTQLVQHPYVMVVPVSVPATSVREFVSWAKGYKTGVSYASSGTGSLIHLTGELFNSATGLKMVHIPYKGIALAFPDMFAGHVHVTFNSILTSLPHITAGRFRALGVTSLKRTARLPEVPTLDESGLARFEVTQWYGVFAPAKTPPARIARLQKEIAAVLTHPDMAKRIASEGSLAVGNTGPEFAKVIATEAGKWRALVKQVGIRAE